MIKKPPEYLSYRKRVCLFCHKEIADEWKVANYHNIWAHLTCYNELANHAKNEHFYRYFMSIGEPTK